MLTVCVGFRLIFAIFSATKARRPLVTKLIKTKTKNESKETKTKRKRK